MAPRSNRWTGIGRGLLGSAIRLRYGAPIVPVACLGARIDADALSTMPDRGARLDTVFGAPVRFSPAPWPRTTAAVAVIQLKVQELLGEHVRAACEATGQSLPALPIEPRNP